MPQKTGVVGYNSKTNTSCINHKRKKNLTAKTVLKMIAVMEASQGAGQSSSTNTTPPTPESTANVKEFSATGRTGRRNAMADILSGLSDDNVWHKLILGEYSLVTSSDLPSKLQTLSVTEKATDDSDTNKPGSSKS